jgi:amino acid adenylation domain-containing protein
MYNLLEKIAQSVSRFPNRNAFFIGDTAYTYHEFASAVTGIRELLEREYPAEERIAFLTYDDLETYAAPFAIMYAGKSFIPINPKNPADRNNAIIRQADMSVVLTSQPDEEAPDLPDYASYVTISGLHAEASNLQLPQIQPEDTAYILFTSGSTGVPKGVPISHLALNAFIEAFFALGYEVDENDRFLQMFDMTFDLSLMSYIAPLCIGASVYTIPPGEIKYTFAYTLMEEHALTFALMVPSILTGLRPFFEEIHLPEMRYSLFCGEALYDDITVEWSNCLPNALVQNVYGPTEATIFCLTYDCLRDKPNKSLNGIVSIGKPMKEMGAIVVNEDHQPVAKGEKGELCLSGPQLTFGYWKNPEKNAEAFFSLDGQTYYRTGDVAFLDKEDDFMFAGRVDHQVKIQGFRVELSEIEHHVREISGLSHVAAIAKADRGGNMRIHLFLENFDGKSEEIIDPLRTKVPSYMVPHKTHNLEVFPLNVNGKIDRKALAATVK